MNVLTCINDQLDGCAKEKLIKARSSSHTMKDHATKCILLYKLNI